MERILDEIEKLIWSHECKKVTLLLSVLFANCKDPNKALKTLYSLSSSLISKNYLKEATTLLNSLKTFSLTTSETLLLTDIKNLLSYCFRLKKNYESAFVEVKGAIDICRSRSDLQGRLPILYLNLSAIYREDLKNYRQAKKFAQLAYDYSSQLLKHEFINPQLARHLAVSILTLGKLDELLNNKESAVIWYSKGIELDNIDIDLMNQFKTRLYNISFEGSLKVSNKRIINSRQGFNINNQRRVSSRMYSKRECESLNSSLSISTQLSFKLNKSYNKPSNSP